MGWPYQAGGGGRRRHSKIDGLPPEIKAAVEGMILDCSITYEDIVVYLREQGQGISKSSICRYARGYVETVQLLQASQANCQAMMDELERYPDLDATEALTRIATHQLMTALASKKDEDWSGVAVDKLLNHISGLTRAVAYKKRVDMQNKTDLEAGADDVKKSLWVAMAREKPELYQRVSAYLESKVQEATP